jgi:hypothetical protein
VKAKAKRKQTRRQRPRESSPVTILKPNFEAYIARLENDLFVCLAALRSYGSIKHVSRETLQQIRDLTIVRNRKLKPEKGRRKDLRKIDSLIVDLVSTIGQKN